MRLCLSLSCKYVSKARANISCRDVQYLAIPSNTLNLFKRCLDEANRTHIERASKLESDLADARKQLAASFKEAEEREEELSVQMNTADALRVEVARLKAVEKTAEELQNFKERFVAEKARNETMVDQVKDFRARTRELERENAKLLVSVL